MRTASKALCFLAVLIVVLSPSRSGSQNGLSSSVVTPRYDPESEIRMKGVVVDASDYFCPASGEAESHLVLQTQDGTVEVHLAATRFIKQYRLTFTQGEKVEVLGSRIILDGREALLAREISRGEEVFVFRDANGKPLW